MKITTVTDNITALQVQAYTIPTDYPESDGTLQWDHTTLVLVELQAQGRTGTGYTYANAATAAFIHSTLRPLLIGQHPQQTARLYESMCAAIRNEGNCGMARMALSAVDNALWDLKAQLLDMPLCRLLGQVRNEALLYGSGGFTSYPQQRLAAQLGAWAQQGFTAVKMKIGRDAAKDVQRVSTARHAIGDKLQLFVDANGAYTTRQSLAQAKKFSEYNISWFEEPVSSGNLEGLRFIREHTTEAINIAAGEYAYTPVDFLNMLQHQAVDVLQADVTRCGGITGFLKAAALCDAFEVPLSFHCAPAQHLHVALAVPRFYIGEYFHDHARIEQLLFDSVPLPENGALKPDLSVNGAGLIFKHRDAVQYKVS
jgi:L-alanine-DL-glutamate epimerase-like enolase superfamily enzyme